MTQLTPADVRHIATLARLTLSEEEVKKFTTELSGILQYIDQLSEADTDDIEPTAQVTGTNNRFREDTVWQHVITSPDELLATSPLPIVDHQIQTPSAHGE